MTNVLSSVLFWWLQERGAMRMRKFLFGVLILAALAWAGLGSAQKYGFYLDYGTYAYKDAGVGYFGFGGYLPMGENLRLGGALQFASALLDSATGVSVRADYMFKRINLMDKPFALDLYLGAQGNVSLLFFSSAMLTQLGANGILGVEYVFPKADLGIFSELLIGPSFAFASEGSAFGFGVSSRFGINLY